MLTLYFHPLASFCHKVLMALYENEIPFRAEFVDLGDSVSRAQLTERWPVGKIPILHDRARDRVIPESTIMIEYLDRYYPGRHALLPAEADDEIEARLWDRFFDQYVHAPMQKIVIDRLRPDSGRDPLGVAEARATLATAYDMIESRMANRTWAAGSDFTIADCAAAPALFYAGIVAPFADGHPSLEAYFERLAALPSFIRVLDEARPYFGNFPYREVMPARFLNPHGA